MPRRAFRVPSPRFSVLSLLPLTLLNIGPVPVTHRSASSPWPSPD